jgi:hypothetical protein
MRGELSRETLLGGLREAKPTLQNRKNQKSAKAPPASDQTTNEPCSLTNAETVAALSASVLTRGAAGICSTVTY